MTESERERLFSAARATLLDEFPDALAIYAYGRTLFERDADQVLAWEASAMSRYARHREELRELLEQFRRTGTGYGP